jgi:hypothetical protein
MACCDHASKRARRDPNKVGREHRHSNKPGMDAPSSREDSSHTSSEEETDGGRSLPKKRVGKVPEFGTIPSTTCEKQSTREEPIPQPAARKRTKTGK